MTWLSRLLTQKTSIHRSRDQKGFRRKMTLEQLEGRVVLSNVLVSYAPLTGALTITGDAGNDGIKITENAAAAAVEPGAVTVAALTPETFINGFSSPFDSHDPVSSIAISYGAGTQGNVEKIVLVGAGKTVPTDVKNVSIASGPQFLGLAVGGGTAGATGVDNNAGSLTVTSSGNINGPGTTPAQLASPTFTGGNATIDASTFGSLSIIQSPPSDLCNAQIELGGDAIAGTVAITEASGAADKITVQPFAGLANTDNVLGATTLVQGDGAGDTVLTDPHAASLSITQGNGAADSITVNPLEITNILGFGLRTVQGNGAGDTTSISHVSDPNNSPSINIPGGTTSLSGISVTQGIGNSDTATVATSTIAGNITITQGNGNTDTASATSDLILTNPFVTGGITITQGSAAAGTGNFDSATVANSTMPGAVNINQQGNGNNDSATVDPTTASGVTIIQGNGNTNSATVSGDTIGLVGVTISQGNGNSDTSLVMNTTTTGSVSITQGNGTGDMATVDPTTIGGNLTISQGTGNSDSVTVTNTKVSGNVTISQTNGNNDAVTVTGTSAGSTTGGMFPTDTFGELTITQGNGASDVVNLNSQGGTNDVFNDVFITQGNGQQPVQVVPTGDTININDSNITSNITINQGTSTALGFYVVNIANSSAVTAGGFTSITQNGGNNSVFLGGASAVGVAVDFTTTWLDIYTGAGGEAFVTAQNTVVVVGSFVGNNWNIDGGNTLDPGVVTNTYLDLGGNNTSGSGVTANPADYNTL